MNNVNETNGNHPNNNAGGDADMARAAGDAERATGATGEGNHTGGTATPPVETLTGEASQADDGHADDAALAAASSGDPDAALFSIEGTGEQGNDGDGATPAVNLDDPVLKAAQAAMAAPEPVKPVAPVKPISAAGDKAVTLCAPTQAKGESNNAFKKRLKAWRAAHPDYVPPTKGATPANGGTGTGEAGKGEAAKPSTPATPPAPSPVSAAVPPKGKASVKAALAANPAMCEGYDFSGMPSWLPFTPSREAIMVVTALGVKTPLSKNHLGMAFAIEQAAPQNRAVDRLVNVYDVGAAMVKVPLFSHTKPDHKINTCTDHEREGYVIALPGVPSVVTRRPLPAGTAAPKAQTVKAYTLTSAGLKKVSEYFTGRGETVPLWLTDHAAAYTAYQAEQAAAVAAADKAAKKAQREANKANA